MIKAVLFDLDGTVINTNELVIASWKYTLKKNLNICPDKDELIKYFGEPLVTTAKRFDEDKADEICTTYHQYNNSMHDEMVTEFEGMEETIRHLKKSGLKVGIVTSKRRVTTERGLALFNLLDLMDVIVTVEDTARHKPCGDPLIKALDILGTLPEESLYVGDTHYDILCGREAGCKTCAVKYSMLPLEELLKYEPDYIVDMPLNIIELIGYENSVAV